MNISNGGNRFSHIGSQHQQNKIDDVIIRRLREMFSRLVLVKEDELRVHALQESLTPPVPDEIGDPSDTCYRSQQGNDRDEVPDGESEENGRRSEPEG